MTRQFPLLCAALLAVSFATFSAGCGKSSTPAAPTSEQAQARAQQGQNAAAAAQAGSAAAAAQGPTGTTPAPGKSSGTP